MLTHIFYISFLLLNVFGSILGLYASRTEHDRAQEFRDAEWKQLPKQMQYRGCLSLIAIALSAIGMASAEYQLFLLYLLVGFGVPSKQFHMRKVRAALMLVLSLLITISHYHWHLNVLNLFR